MHMEELYTVESLAKMFDLTTRTIRNYLRDGRLKGRKVGGQWRFTQADIEDLLKDAEVTGTLDHQAKQEVLDFLDGVNTDLTGTMQICSIVDLYITAEAAQEKSQALCDLINGAEETGFLRFWFNYVEAEDKARFVLFASPELTCTAMEILKG